MIDLARGGDVFDRLSSRTTYHEGNARDLAKNFLESIQYVHSENIIHRDLKPENLLLVNEVDDTKLKLADFGFATLVDSNGRTTRCGTPAFVAPEVVQGIPYNTKADMWSVGCILYFLLAGYPPFQDKTHHGLFRKIRGGDYVFHDQYWKSISLEAKQLISLLLTTDPSKRPTATQALKHRWLTPHMCNNKLRSSDLSSSLTEIKRFHARRKLKGAGYSVTYAVSADFWKTEFVSFGYLSHAFQSSRTSGSSEHTTTPKSPFHERYTLHHKIKSGTFSAVWEATNNETKVKVAVKVVSRKNLTPNDDQQVLNEVSIMQSLNHRHIVSLIDFYEEKTKFFVVMELLTGGDVFDRIVERTHYTEKDARDLIKNLLEAIYYLHSHNVAHRDLKPQNLLLAHEGDDADVKIADFGFSKRVHTPLSLLTRCGTPTYVAPEVLKNHPHDTAADMWSVGVILFVLLVGYPPFMEENQRTLFQKIRMGSYEFYEQDWECVSADARDLISNLLTVDPKGRMSARDALRSPWVSGDDDELASKDLNSSLDELRKLKLEELYEIHDY